MLSSEGFVKEPKKEMTMMDKVWKQGCKLLEDIDSKQVFHAFI
jgi:hypothetical protein